MRCECDLELAKKFSNHEASWNPLYHRRWGDAPFDSGTCRTNHRAPAPAVEALQHAAYSDRVGFETDFAALKDGEVFYGNQKIENFENEKSENQKLTHGEVVGCCGQAPRVHYFRRGQKCCSDGQITDINAPCNIDLIN